MYPTPANLFVSFVVKFQRSVMDDDGSIYSTSCVQNGERAERQPWLVSLKLYEQFLQLCIRKAFEELDIVLDICPAGFFLVLRRTARWTEKIWGRTVSASLLKLADELHSNCTD